MIDEGRPIHDVHVEFIWAIGKVPRVWVDPEDGIRRLDSTLDWSKTESNDGALFL